MRNGTIAAITLVLSACTIMNTPYRPVASDISKPGLGEFATAYLGEELLIQGNVAEYEAIKLPVDSVVRDGISLRAGVYLKMGSGDTSDYYAPSADTGAKVIGPRTVNLGAIQVYRDGQVVCAVSKQWVSVCNKKIQSERIRFPLVRTDTFQQSLIYNGRAGSKINLAYREISGGVAKPAFSNTVEYDLSDSKTIGYRGARIEVIEATGELIQYRVLENFSRPN